MSTWQQCHTFNISTKCFGDSWISSHKVDANVFYWQSIFLNFFNEKVFHFHIVSTFRTLAISRKEDNFEIMTINYQQFGYTVDNSKPQNKVPQPFSLNHGLKVCCKFSFHCG